MNPQGTFVFGFKQPSKEEAAHDFVWRAHLRGPSKGEVVIFNRSHYEDVLVVRVHNLVPESVWSKRYDQINDFETMLTQNDTTILKFFLHISPEEQLSRFKQRLDDPSRHWKISESDYSERDYGRNIRTLTKKQSQKRAQSTRPGTLFQQTISGSGTWQCRRSLPIRWMRWA
jgi:polyphosphate kinase 2 (PPK2 family)